MLFLRQSLKYSANNVNVEKVDGENLLKKDKYFSFINESQFFLNFIVTIFYTRKVAIGRVPL